MIKISDTLYYDETLDFLLQSEEVKDFLINKTSTEIPDQIINEDFRPSTYKWIDKTYDYILNKIFVYKNSATDPEAGLILYYNYSIENNTWFEPNNHWQVKQEYLKCFQMMEEVPELAMYRKAHDIVTYKRNGMIYFYVRFFEPGYVELLQSYDCEITENKNYVEVV